MSFDPEEAAENEIGWYEDHHLRNYDEVLKKMARVHEIVFGLNSEVAIMVVLPKIKAAKEHDLAEKEGLSERESRQHWDKAKEFMVQHFSMLKEAIRAEKEKSDWQRALFAEMERFNENPSDWGAISTLTIMGYNPLEIPKGPEP